MQEINCFGLDVENIVEFMTISKETDKMTLFYPVLLEDVQDLMTYISYPEEDLLYYKSLEAQLDHLLFKYREGWIKSERQIFYSSDECISSIQFILNDENDIDKMIVYCRSSHIRQMESDLAFLKYYAKKVNEDVLISVMMGMPHLVNQ